MRRASAAGCFVWDKRWQLGHQGRARDGRSGMRQCPQRQRRRLRNLTPSFLLSSGYVAERGPERSLASERRKACTHIKDPNMDTGVPVHEWEQYPRKHGAIF